MQYRGLGLDRFQREAIEHIEAGHSVIVSAPTGTGKTLIADYLIEQTLERGQELIYTSPIKALSNQKYRQYSKLFGEEKVGLVTGDLVINRDAPVRIMTTEILRNILLEGRHEGSRSPAEAELPDLRRLHAVVIDEIHFLADPERGTVWEELLIYLPTRIRILGLSATLSNLDEFAHWLSQTRQSPMQVIHEPKRAVPLRFLMANTEVGAATIEQFSRHYGRWRKQQRGSKERSTTGKQRRSFEGRTRHIDLIEMMHPQSYPALYFIFSRAMVERLAFELGHSQVGKRLADASLKASLEQRLRRFDQEHPDVLPQKLRRLYELGIAFHHAGLHVQLKGLVEELYEHSLIRVLYCTSTFALGINMPARTVIFDSLMIYNGQELAPLTVREFMQMAGRAGRRGIDTEGDIIIRQDFEDYDEVQPLLKQLLEGRSEPVTSSFNLSFHTIIHLLERFAQDDIRALVQRSFRAYQSLRAADHLDHEVQRRATLLEASPEALLTQPNPKQRARLRQLRGELLTLKRELLEERRPLLWEDFSRKAEFLRTYNYIDEHYRLLPSAQIMKHLKIEEILMTELILAGVFETLGAEETFGVFCGLVATLPTKARVRRPDRKWRDIMERITLVAQSDPVRHSAQLLGVEPNCTLELMPLGERWAAGDKLADIHSAIDNPTDLSGDLVGAFRRAKDLVSQLREVYHEDQDRARSLAQLMRRVTRDEVHVLY